MKDKYQLLNELQFQLGLAQRYAIILEQRISNRMEVEPYHNLLRTAVIEVNELDTQLIQLLKAQQEAA
jgi:hypothetical protein